MTLHLGSARTCLQIASILLGAIGLQGCGSSDSDHVDRAALKPQLLDDRAEIEAYVEAFPYDDYGIYDVPGVGKYYIDDNPAPVKVFLKRGQPWETHVIEQFEKYVVPGSTVLDVGAHIGSLTVTLARLVGPEGRVYAFEPQRKVYRELVHNLRLNEMRQAVPLRYAVSSAPGILEMDSPHGGADGQVHIGRGGDKVEARSIDSFNFKNVSLIKIDVEGHEYEALKGAERTIRSQHPVIIVEIIPEPERTKQLLSDYGYTYRVIKPVRGSMNDYIALYEPQKPASE